MKSSTISKVIRRGIMPQDPHFFKVYEDIENKEGSERRLRLKVNNTRGFEMIERYDNSGDISRWLNSDGKAIRLGRLVAVEIWKRGEELLLAVAKPDWELYRLSNKGKVLTVISRVS